jgi:hypothetical protein
MMTFRAGLKCPTAREAGQMLALRRRQLGGIPARLGHLTTSSTVLPKRRPFSMNAASCLSPRIQPGFTRTVLRPVLRHAGENFPGARHLLSREIDELCDALASAPPITQPASTCTNFSLPADGFPSSDWPDLLEFKLAASHPRDRRPAHRRIVE